MENWFKKAVWKTEDIYLFPCFEKPKAASKSTSKALSQIQLFKTYKKLKAQVKCKWEQFKVYYSEEKSNTIRLTT